MSDVVDPATRSRMMAGIRGKDTKPEMLVRRYLHGRGFRYRLHDRKLPGRPDLVLGRFRSVVEVRGCFWHGHHGCKYATRPRSNAAFWAAKLRANCERDSRNLAALEASGWRVLVIWECEVHDERALARLAHEISR
ncbi:MAG: DNA mismatch endonuclease Vsr [Gemmatimonadaceae bacterium]|nr:DNA mismatch endonuclease Vsr [Gemmatimonadaceae bacterium]